MTHDELYAAAKAALDRLFADTTVERRVTRESLSALCDEVHSMIDALDEDEP